MASRRNSLKQSLLADVDDGHAAAIPLRDVEFLAGLDQCIRKWADAVGTRGRCETNSGAHLTGRRVDEHHGVLEIEGGIEDDTIGRNREARRVDPGRGGTERNGRAFGHGTPIEVIHANLVVATSSGIHASTIRRDGDPQKERLGAAVRNRLDDLPRRGIEEHETLLALTVVGDQQVSAIRSGRDTQRSISDLDLKTGGREQPMIWGDSRPVWLRANATEEGRAHHSARSQDDDQQNHKDRPPGFEPHSASPPERAEVSGRIGNESTNFARPDSTLLASQRLRRRTL